MSSKHINALDGVRGMAVIMVVCFHIGAGGTSKNPIVHFIGTVNNFGWTGVSLFFVLSGFLITGILHETRDDPRRLRNFYARRSLRIFPLYYFALLLVVLAAIPVHLFRDSVTHLPVYLAYLQNVQPFDTHAAPLPSPLYVFHFWSLAVEEQFYLLWPFLVYRVKSLRGTAILCGLVILASGLYKFMSGDQSEDSLLINAGALALGGLLAMAYRTHIWSRLTQVSPLLFVISAMILRYIPGAQLGPVLFMLSILWGSLLVMAISQPSVRRLFLMGWLRWIGSISYGIYVYHALFIPQFDWITTKLAPSLSHQQHAAFRFVVTVSLTILISWLSFRYFERPISSLKKRFRPAPAVSSEVVLPMAHGLHGERTI